MLKPAPANKHSTVYCSIMSNGLTLIKYYCHVELYSMSKQVSTSREGKVYFYIIFTFTIINLIFLSVLRVDKQEKDYNV